jgi:DNA-binding CsgD family transcriptional regulator
MTVRLVWVEPSPAGFGTNAIGYKQVRSKDKGCLMWTDKDGGVLLSAHEHRIAVRAADGRSNQDIGDDFGVCARTVEHHLTKVYRKLRIDGRNQLRAALRRYSVVQANRRRLVPRVA